MSTKAKKIKVLRKSYPYAFGMRFQKYFMDNMGLHKISEFEDKLKLLINEKPDVDNFELLEVFGWFLISAIQCAAKEQIEFDLYDLLDDVQQQGFQNFKGVFEDYAAHQVKVYEANPNALGKSKK
jgi:hypothetical protein